MVISYRPRHGVLQDATNIFIHIGRNGWQDILSPDPKMTNPAAGLWTFDYDIPYDTRRINFVFNNGAGTWDNNNGVDYSATVLNCATGEESDITLVYGVPVISGDPAAPGDQNNVGDRMDLNREGGRAVRTDLSASAISGSCTRTTMRPTSTWGRWAATWPARTTRSSCSWTWIRGPRTP